jgi:putative transposase
MSALGILLASRTLHRSCDVSRVHSKVERLDLETLLSGVSSKARNLCSRGILFALPAETELGFSASASEVLVSSRTHDRYSCAMPTHPGRLHHNTPGWVPDGAPFHIRLRVDSAQAAALIEPALGIQLLLAAKRYHDLGHWWCELFLLMPDHTHAILGFPASAGMSKTVRQWKRGTARFQKVQWQDGYFDHRLRSEGESQEKWGYIRRNPVVKGLSRNEDEWPWWWSAVVGNKLLPEEFSRPGGDT